MSRLSNAIREKKRLVGTLVSVASPAMAEALSKSGLDWLFFDLEHSTMTLAEVQSMIQAMHPGCLSMIRVEDALPVYVKRALDTGCDGVIVPQVNSPELAEAMAAAGKFPPLGRRSVGLGRSLGYGATLAEGVKGENDRTALIVQIEHRDAVERVDDILRVDGVDGIFVGPYDLSGSMGIPGNVGDGRVQDAIGQALAAAREARKPAGIFVGNADAARKEFARGFELIAVSSDLIQLTAKCAETAAAARG